MGDGEGLWMDISVMVVVGRVFDGFVFMWEKERDDLLVLIWYGRRLTFGGYMLGGGRYAVVICGKENEK